MINFSDLPEMDSFEMEFTEKNLPTNVGESITPMPTSAPTLGPGRCICCSHPQRYLLERRVTRELATLPIASPSVPKYFADSQQLPSQLSQPQLQQPQLPDDDAIAIDPDFIDDTAMEFGVTPEELLHHMEYHMSVKPGAGQTQSLEVRASTQEASLVADALYDGLATLAHVGGIIRRLGDDRLPRVLSKEMVDLYTNAQRAVRDQTELLLRMDAQFNGTRDTSTTGLDALAAVIQASQQAALEANHLEGEKVPPSPTTPC